ncbi:F1F0 ATP synthase assembly protein-like protein Atp11 [Myriangium duriaei CBS 260.36]|uniref:F1F0 ATP synthase assembly protein-like protein Atp11 n=1 Tax=Myriangium duriaei CBS 260.36 TaxID=1168546 RepID=A0A9P4JCW9_9PEZI|nr:F1F0 ATP synthase assembly protein-like protein Atp11 [Myriangium duriaei CBS 260.36]
MRVLQQVASRHIARSCRLPTLVEQRRWAQVHDIRFLTSHQKPAEKVLEKYRNKLDQRAKQEGLDGIGSLKEKYQDKISDLRRKATVPGATGPPQSTATNAPYQAPAPPQPQPTSPATQYTAEAKAGVKTLDSFIDVEKTRVLPQKEIEYLWRLRHASNERSLCATIQADMYDRIASTARKHPQFVLPLPREGQGAEIHFLQWTFPSENTVTVLFTHLAEYKLRGEYSQPHTTVTHHLDLSKDTGLVLLQGTVLPDRGVSVDEGKFLLMCLQKFYSQTSEQTPRRKLLEQFTQGDASFEVQKLLEEAEKIP